MSSNYQHYYNITFLDDLHNYFPDILYSDNNRFNNVNDLLEYIRSQTRNQFDLFSSARRNARRNNNEIISQIPERSIINDNQINDNQINDNQNNDNQNNYNQIRIRFNTEEFIPLPTSPQGLSNNDINTLLGPLTNIVNLLYPPTTPFTMEPVLVRPTQEQITNATSIVELSSNTEVCAICQETMVDGRIRKINHCRHTFHDSCISRHFNNSVRCPICRYDIRNTV